MKQHYILLETDDADSSFIIQSNVYNEESGETVLEKRYYEIYSLPSVEDIKVYKIANKQIIVQESNQVEAFKSLKKIYPNLYRRSHKNFYEKKLHIQV